MSLSEKTKPQGAKPGVSETALPGRLRKYKRNRTSAHGIKLPPPLASLEIELRVFGALISNPAQQYFYVPNRTLTALRWMGAERVARAATLAGKSKAEAVTLILDAIAPGANPPFHFDRNCAAWVVGSELLTLSRKDGRK